MKYIAIIGDIKRSKKLNERNEAQRNLKTILKQVNIKYGDELESTFLVTLGDEFQGLIIV